MKETPEGLTVEKGFLQQLMMSNRYLCDKDFTYFNAKDDFIITPESVYKRRIWFKIKEFEVIRDSSTIDASDWVEIAEQIEQNYDDFDSFIILHGTDTMAYTASALSFMLENLQKTVVLTGSQVPLKEMRNDAFDNLLGALTVAGHYTIPEVTLFFKDRLFRGNRTSKIDTYGLGAFETPNLAPLGEFGLLFKPDWKLIRKSSVNQLHVQKKISKKIGVLKMFPMIMPEVVTGVLNSGVQAVIIEAFGAGNLPVNRPEISKAFKDACDKGIILVVRTQCLKGGVNALYAVGKQLLDLGVISAADMTSEACVTKIGYLLGKGYSTEEIKKLMQENLRGELTEPTQDTFEMADDNFIKALADTMKIGTEYSHLKQAIFPSIINYASDYGYVSVLEELKKNGANFEHGDIYERSPAHIAARKDQVQVLEYLRDEGVNMNLQDLHGRTPLAVALFNRQYKAVKVLVNAGGQIIAPMKYIQEFLHDAAAKKDLDAIKHFYFSGLKNLDIYKNFDGRTIGHIAVSNSDYQMIKFLKENTSYNFNTKDRWGKTPIDEAKELKDVEMLKVFGASQEDINKILNPDTTKKEEETKNNNK